jgi:hypothetical protein
MLLMADASLNVTLVGGGITGPNGAGMRDLGTLGALSALLIASAITVPFDPRNINNLYSI